MNISLNFTLFLIFSGVYFMLYKYFNEYTSSSGFTNASFLLKLDKYYVHNKFYSFFILIFYLLCNTLVFLFIRISLLGTSQNFIIAEGFYNFFLLINIILYILNIGFYMQVLDMLFFRYIIGLHFFLYQKDWYIKLNDFQRDHSGLLSEMFLTGGNFYFNITQNMEKTFIQKYKIVLYFFKYLAQFFYLMHLYISPFVSYISYSFVILCFIYDVYHGILFYIYYILLIHFMVKFISKCRKFLYVKDCYLDPKISRYFYNNTLSYQEIYKTLLLNPTDSYLSTIIFDKHTKFILQSQEELKEYMKNNFQVYYIIQRKVDANYILSRVKRYNIIFLLLLGNLYYFININKYNIIVYDFLEIKPVYLLLPLLVITCFYEKVSLRDTTEEEEILTSKQRIEIKKHIIIFYFISILQALIILYIMLVNKVILMPKEIILDFYYITIIENFSIEEK